MILFQWIVDFVVGSNFGREQIWTEPTIIEQ